MLLMNGDSKILLNKIESDSIDSVVCDPPYGLISIQKRFGKANSAPAKHGKDGRYKRLSKGFLGAYWDGTGIEYDIEFWSEVCRVLKPGGHLLAFSGTRTYHKMVTAIEESGFDIRDTISYNFVQGFPKSHDISKDIDRINGKEQKIVGKNPNDRKVRENSLNNYGLQGGVGKANITEPVSEQAKEWQGWGTSLNPSMELICMARKPISEKNIALNVLKWGTGAINIDDSRIDLDGEIVPINKLESWSGFGQLDNPNYVQEINTLGRFPKNVIFDEQSLKYVDEGKHRFFFCAKPNQEERNLGLDGNNTHSTIKPITLMRYLCNLVTPKKGIILDPFMGSGSTGCAAVIEDYEFIGIELIEEYYNIAVKRIEYYTNNKQYKLNL